MLVQCELQGKRHNKLHSPIFTLLKLIPSTSSQVQNVLVKIYLVFVHTGTDPGFFAKGGWDINFTTSFSSHLSRYA